MAYYEGFNIETQEEFVQFMNFLDDLNSSFQRYGHALPFGEDLLSQAMRIHVDARIAAGDGAVFEDVLDEA